jgi:SAM-dependent methyltransferase
MGYFPQVSREHYFRGSYKTKERWISYWYQIDLVNSLSPQTVLEIGPGAGVVSDTLRKQGIEVKTADISPDLNPDKIASVTDLPFEDNSFDAVLACEVLEHIHFEDFKKALGEIRRVTKKFAVISLPHAGFIFSFGFKFPGIERKDAILKLPFFWKKHEFNGEHYWELGKRGYAVRSIKQKIREAGFKILRSFLPADDPAHYFFLLEKL